MKKLHNLFFLSGVLLMAASLCLLLFTQLRSSRAEAVCAEAVSKIEALLPERMAGLPGAYANPEMPVLQIDGQDYACLLEVPGFGITLPVASQWDRKDVFSHPCRFFGSAYDNSLIIGGADQSGQLDFLSRLDIGDSIRITDMNGTEFRYAVSQIDRSSSADYEVLASQAYGLTLFVRSSHFREYILVRCTTTAQ